MASDPAPSRISLHVKITIAPENLDKFWEAMRPVYDAVCAEPKCLFFEIYRSPTEPGVLKWVEDWNATVDWLMNVQLKKDYYKPYFEATLPMYLKEREAEIWVRMDGNSWTYIAQEMTM